VPPRTLRAGYVLRLRDGGAGGLLVSRQPREGYWLGGVSGKGGGGVQGGREGGDRPSWRRLDPFEPFEPLEPLEPLVPPDIVVGSLGVLKDEIEVGEKGGGAGKYVVGAEEGGEYEKEVSLR